jgi:hypothetical protein
MKIGICALVLLGSAAITTPSLAQEVVQQTTIIGELRSNLNRFIGRNLFGLGHANLGVVSTADSDAGVIGVVGRFGEFALISDTLLTRDGLTLYAPTLTRGDIKLASNAQYAHPGSVLTAPHVLIIEPPPG